MDQKIGIIGIIVKDRKKNSPPVNKILSEHSEIIIGRMGIPQRQEDTGLISLFVEGNTDRIGSLTGKLGSLKGITVKSLLMPLSDR
ncbi:MAG TPA: iron-only hydrogenase system regulator [Syntrophorhabdaceae bacterium]|nr:iron-only hydrogenase system regulator [Syntrophorhabdaceae bacterium]HOL06442.1 iron-only hydrogenase system regulator [Syntrophorhabdaceae bacterium]HON85950.1 iron-only hydrogenase system regulator [Syntrophorhabdaceae bacterium]HOT43179.1 iron-only hydrogenase system regulator [Syntrophorhabdaceae bacterium]HPC67235.1 iron-only hydrogenase system regulator [Syntrophorhabdaceae bacterium]